MISSIGSDRIASLKVLGQGCVRGPEPFTPHSKEGGVLFGGEGWMSHRMVESELIC